MTNLNYKEYGKKSAGLNKETRIKRVEQWVRIGIMSRDYADKLIAEINEKNKEYFEEMRCYYE